MKELFLAMLEEESVSSATESPFSLLVFTMITFQIFPLLGILPFMVIQGCHLKQFNLSSRV